MISLYVMTALKYTLGAEYKYLIGCNDKYENVKFQIYCHLYEVSGRNLSTK